MLADIQQGQINCVVVKNLARSFRNSGDQSYYLGDWFPRHNVRFISLYQQPLDTYKDPQNAQSIAVPVQGVLNEEHARGTSESVRRTFDMKREKGLHIGSFAAYGYAKDPRDKNALVPDPEAASHVQSIFAWFLQGHSKSAIVRQLNHSGVLCPSAYKRSKGLKYKNPKASGQSPLWCAATVGGILKNRIYTGDMVQGRHRIKSYKIHVQEAVPQDEWFVVENTHTPIINRRDFAAAQLLLQNDTRTAPGRKGLYLFSGLLRCADCGRAMTRSKVGDNVYYHCRTYKDRSKTACTKHTVRHRDLEEAVLSAIRQVIYQLADVPKVIARADASPRQKSKAARLDELIAAKEKDRQRVMCYRQGLYQDWKDGQISREDYLHMQESYLRQASDIEQAIANLKEEKAAPENSPHIEAPTLAALRSGGNIRELTRDILVALVKSIKVRENGGIAIKFRFAGDNMLPPEA